MGAARLRRGYLDWLRGLAVLIMIEAHVLDSWTRIADRRSLRFAWSMIVGGFGAPLFLFLAGVSVALSAGSKLRRTGDRRSAAKAVMQRGLWVFGLAFLFRLQAWILGWGSPRTLLTVDILNIMGPAIIVAGAIWGACRSTFSRCAAFAVSTLAMAFATPLVRNTRLLDALPDPFEAYLRPSGGLSHFYMFPWAGFVAAGALVGVLIDRARTREDESRLNSWIFAAGVSVALASYAASFLPTPFEHSEFWGSSPAFFLLRTGLMIATVGIAYAWVRRTAGWGWTPLEQLGRTSLFIYWIHVEMVYGLISLRMHKALSLPAAWGAFALFTLLMFACSLAKDRVTAWKDRPQSPQAPAFAPH